MSPESIWLRVVAPVPTTTLAKIAEVAPKLTFIRHGGVVDLNGQLRNIVEFVTVVTTTEESSINREEQA